VPDREYTLIDLFAGAGGMTQGFVAAGFKPVHAVECDQAAADTYEANFGTHVFRHRIENLDLADLPPADVVIGGPPCQGFSPLGKMSPQDQRMREQTALNGLWRYFIAVIERVKPSAFVMENVPELLKSLQYAALKHAAEDLGFSIAAGVLLAVEFGVPQQRKRAFILGVRHATAGLPEPSNDRRTVRDAIGHVPLQPTGDDWHIGRNPTAQSLERYKCVPPGGNRFDLIRNRPDLAPACWLRKKSGSTDVFGRLEWDKPALAIRTEFFKPEKGRYLHPAADRPITHREAALLQTFPEHFVFKGSKIEVARQIGNAVPPRLAAAVARKVCELLEAPRNVVGREAVGG
jgi:DNA (cytosine-5)-methyltransferase 1